MQTEEIKTRIDAYWRQKELKEFEKTEIALRDNSPRLAFANREAVTIDPSWLETNGLVHTVVGLNPYQDGFDDERGCGNRCLTCWLDEEYLKLHPAHILGYEQTVIGSLVDKLPIFFEQSANRMRPYLNEQKEVQAADWRIRISGNIQGDPVMIDPEGTRRIISYIKPLISQGRMYGAKLFADTQANQYVLSSEQWAEFGFDRVYISVDAVSSIAAYMVAHGINAQAFVNLILNIRNIDSAGIGVGLSFVDVKHYRLTDEEKANMPKYLQAGQAPEAIADFLDLLNLKQHPLIRRWYPRFSTDPTFLKQLHAGDKVYERNKYNLPITASLDVLRIPQERLEKLNLKGLR